MYADLDTLSQEAEGIVRSIGLPPCPAILMKLVREARNDEPDFRRLGQLISSDVSLAAALMKTINSSFYGLSTKASSINQALLLMGLRNVTHLVTGLLLRQAFAVGTDSRMDEFFDYSSGIARASARLATHVHGVDRDIAYTFGLFRDCGAPAMMSHFTDYKPCYARDDLPASSLVTEAEERDFGIHHAYMGYYLAKEWLLPELIFQSVLWHHDYRALEAGDAQLEPAGEKLVAIAFAADYVLSQHASGTPGDEWASRSDYSLGQLDMDEADLNALMPEMTEALEERV